MVLIPRTVSPFSLWEKALIGAVLQTAHGQSPLPLEKELIGAVLQTAHDQSPLPLGEG